MPEAKDLLISADGLKGVRSFVANSHIKNLSPPPHLGEHTRRDISNAAIIPQATSVINHVVTKLFGAPLTSIPIHARL